MQYWCRTCSVLEPQRYAALKLWLAVLLASLAGCGGGQENGYTEDVADATAQPVQETSVIEAPNTAEAAANGVDETLLRQDLARLTGTSPAPLASGPTSIVDRGNEEGRRAAAEYMKVSFEETGIPARIIEFDHEGRRGFNVEATLEGTGGRRHLWVTAHLDSFYNAGANDDASGLVSVLSTARVMKKQNPEHTIHFVAYDLEELGLVGSTLYVGDRVSEIREREGERAIIGNLHSDMIGYDGGGGFEAVMGTCGNRSGTIGEAVRHAAEITDSPMNLEEDCLGRSDHEHFWEAGLPAAVLTDGSKYDGYPWYHDPADTADKVNIPYMRSMIQLTAAATALLSREP